MKNSLSFLRTHYVGIIFYAVMVYLYFDNRPFANKNQQYAGLFGILFFTPLVIAAVYAHFFYKNRKTRN